MQLLSERDYVHVAGGCGDCVKAVRNPAPPGGVSAPLPGGTWSEPQPPAGDLF